MNCKVWVSDLVHDLSNSEILIASGTARNATISFNKLPTRTIMLPEQAIGQLGMHCQMQTDTFLIHKKSFRQLSTFDTNNSCDYEVIDKKDLLQEGELHVIERMHFHQTIAIEMTSSINSLANNTAKIASNLHKTFSLIAVNSKIMNSVTEITYIIQKAKASTAKSDEGIVSREALSALLIKYISREKLTARHFAIITILSS